MNTNNNEGKLEPTAAMSGEPADNVADTPIDSTDNGSGGKKGADKERGLISIGLKSFLSVVAILFILIIATGILTFFIPQGTLVFNEAAGEYVYTLGVVKGYPVWRWFTAFVETLWSDGNLSIIMVSLFIVVLGGCFNIMDRTGGIKSIIQALIKKFETKKYLLMCLIILIFMCLGAFFGIFEESVALLPVIIMLSVSLGWDTFAGMAMCLLASGFGFASAITNPFTVGIASSLAGVSLLDGIVFRLTMFVLMYALLCGFVYLYIRMIEKKPSRSPTFESDSKRRGELMSQMEKKEEFSARSLKGYVAFFASLFGILLLSAIVGIFVSFIQDISIVIIMLTFLIGTFIAGFYVTRDFGRIGKLFLKGALGILPAALLVMLAGSVKLILANSGIEGTILNWTAEMMKGMSKYSAALMVFAIIFIFQFFIGSASAKAMLILPIILPICSIIGLNPVIAILAFVIADGFTNVIFPTNPVLLLGLAVSEFSYVSWFKRTALLQLVAHGIGIGLLMIAVAIL